MDIAELYGHHGDGHWGIFLLMVTDERSPSRGVALMHA